MRRNHALGILTITILILANPGLTNTAFGSTIPADSRKAAADFTLTDAGGTPFKLSQYRGRVVLLDFWATWCHGCKTEIPWYIEFQNKYKNLGLSVVGVSMDESWTAVRPFLVEHGVNYVVGVGNDALSKQYNITALPVTLLIDQQGRIAESHVGVVDRLVFEEDILKLLGEQAVPLAKN
jgi:peroxiredoxin